MADTIQIDLESLGARMVQAARLAVAMHLGQAMAPGALRQQVSIGGTDPFAVNLSAHRRENPVTDDGLSPVVGRAE